MDLATRKPSVTITRAVWAEWWGQDLHGSRLREKWEMGTEAVIVDNVFQGMCSKGEHKNEKVARRQEVGSREVLSFIFCF